MPEEPKKAVFQVDDYFELLALNKALRLLKFSYPSLDDSLPGSPLMAAMANRVVDTLVAIEIERGRLDLGVEWKGKIVPSSHIWNNLLAHAQESSKWLQWSLEQKQEFAQILISPLEADEKIIAQFVYEVDALLKDK